MPARADVRRALATSSARHDRGASRYRGIAFRHFRAEETLTARLLLAYDSPHHYVHVL